MKCLVAAFILSKKDQCTKNMKKNDEKFKKKIDRIIRKVKINNLVFVLKTVRNNEMKREFRIKIK